MMLSIKDVAQRLNLPIETVLRWVRQGKIPMQSIRGEYVIRLAMLERWAKDHKLDVRTPAATVTSDVEPDFDGILPAMEPSSVSKTVRARRHLLRCGWRPARSRPAVRRGAGPQYRCIGL